MKILFICGKKRYFLEKEEKGLVLAGVVGCHFLGIFFHRDKSSSEEVHPFTLLTLRFGIGGFLLFVFQLRKDKWFLRTFSPKDWFLIFLLAIAGMSGHTLLQAFGLLYTTAINTGWIVAVIPIFITISARLFLKEAIRVRTGIGIFIGFLGVFLVISKGVFSFSLFHFGSTLGDFLVLFSALTWTAFTVGGRGFLSRVPALTAITPVMIVGSLTTFPFTFLKWQWNILPHLSLSAWMGILFLGVFCSGLAYLFWYSALEKKDLKIVGMYLYLEPFVTLIGAYFLINEQVQRVSLMGGGMILLGVYLATKRRSTQKS